MNNENALALDDNTSGTFSEGMYCTQGTRDDNPEMYRHFDNILVSWLTIFQCTTMTDWVFTMYDCMDAVSDWVWLVFVAIVLLGNFFILNLALAVLYYYFTMDKQQKHGAWSIPCWCYHFSGTR